MFLYIYCESLKYKCIILILYTYRSFSIPIFFCQIFEMHCWKMPSYNSLYTYCIIRIPYITNYAENYYILKDRL